MSDYTSRVDHLAGLSDDWDGYGANAPTQAALRTLRAVNVVPTSDGGAQIEWHCNGQDLEIEIAPDGRFEEPWLQDLPTEGDDSGE